MTALPLPPAALALASLLLAAACAPGGAGRGTEVSRSAGEARAIAAAQDPDGTCWATEITPAVYEQVPGQVQVVQAERAPDGTVIRPPIYRNATVPKVVKPRAELRFEAPCPAQMTPEFIASVQRALLARGYFRGAPTGRMDPATVRAVRRYQGDNGLESGHLALATARELGLVPVELADEG